MLNCKDLHNEVTCKYMEEVRYKIKKNSRLYHYTTISTLQNIIDSNSFHLRDYRYLNDPTEVKYTINILEEVLNKLKSKNKITEDGIRTFHSCLSLAEIENKQGYEYPPHILSFSEDRDNLSMWRAYANNAKGITIGIKPPNHNKKKSAKFFY